MLADSPARGSGTRGGTRMFGTKRRQALVAAFVCGRLLLLLLLLLYQRRQPELPQPTIIILLSTRSQSRPNRLLLGAPPECIRVLAHQSLFIRHCTLHFQRRRTRTNWLRRQNMELDIWQDVHLLGATAPPSPSGPTTVDFVC